MQSKDKNLLAALLRSFSVVTQIGITTAACLFIGVMLGRFLDGKLNSFPIFLLIFSLLGLAAAIKAIFDLAKKD